MVSATAAVWLLSVAPAVHAAEVSPADRAATDAYLHARYEYVKATVAVLPAMTADALAYTKRLEDECRGVLAGSEPAPSPAPDPREEGERDRRLHETSAVMMELARSTIAAESAPLAPADTSFAAAVAPLRWSDQEVASAVAQELQEFAAARVGPDAAEVCADLRAWQQSGYTRLAPRTRELEAQQQKELEAVVAGRSVDALLKPYEGPAERALLARATTFGSHAAANATEQLDRGYERLQAALSGGKAIVGRPPHRATTVLGKGTTSSGLRFTVTPDRSSFKRRACRAEVVVEYSGTVRGGEIAFSGGGGPICVAGHAVRPRPLLSCEEGRLNLTQVLPADVRRVRLRLLDGRTLVSRTVPIAARYGGPAALYVQSLPSGGSRPVSIVELAGDGATTLATVPVPTHARCPTQAEEETPNAKLVRGTSPAGTQFAIEGDYLGPKGRGGFVLQLESGFESESQNHTVQGPRSKEAPFEPDLGGACTPTEWTVVYGVLKPPGASVVAISASGGEQPLQTVPIPARLHPGGVLAFGVFGQPPVRLVVRDAHGSTIESEDLTAHDERRREYCEGLAEPAQ
jgi:hypothetical protein